MQQPQVNTLVGITGGNKNGYPVNGLFSIPFAGLNPENGVPMFYDENGTITSDINFQSTSTDYLKYEGQIPNIQEGLTIPLLGKVSH